MNRRNLLPKGIQASNVLNLNSNKDIQIINNSEWYSSMSVLEFMSLVGEYRLNQMLSKDSVASRLSSAAGINYAEFSYQLFQAYDFWFLYKKYGCNLQIGGSDQWGNICAGIEVIRKNSNKELASNLPVSDSKQDEQDEIDKVYGITIPLMTNASGEKFGKSAGNAIWLDPKKLSPFDFYQFFRKANDCDVEKYLLSFTFLGVDEIQKTVNAGGQSAQKLLASEVTELVHGCNP